MRDESRKISTGYTGTTGVENFMNNFGRLI
jgi:hypothetical protein